MNYRLFLIVLFIQSSVSAQNKPTLISPGMRVFGLYTSKEPIYDTPGGWGFGPTLRIRPISWLYLQAGISYNYLFTSESQITKYRMRTVDWQLGFVPFQKYPIHVSIGGLQHRYFIETKEYNEQGFVFIPALSETRQMDGLSLGVGYTYLNQFECHLRFEREPFIANSENPLMTHFIKFEVCWFPDYRKWLNTSKADSD